MSLSLVGSTFAIAAFSLAQFGSVQAIAQPINLGGLDDVETSTTTKAPTELTTETTELDPTTILAITSKTTEEGDTSTLATLPTTTSTLATINPLDVAPTTTTKTSVWSNTWTHVKDTASVTTTTTGYNQWGFQGDQSVWEATTTAKPLNVIATDSSGSLIVAGATGISSTIAAVSEQAVSGTTLSTIETGSSSSSSSNTTASISSNSTSGASRSFGNAHQENSWKKNLLIGSVIGFTVFLHAL